MRKMIAWALALALMLMLAMSAVAEPATIEPGTGWLKCTIDGAPVEFTYEGYTGGMAGDTYHFTADQYDLTVVFDKGLTVDEPMGDNAIRSIEVISSNSTSSGYYATRKSTTVDVECEVSLTEKTAEGLMAGTFRAVVLTADRWVGDLRPGMLEKLPLEDGSFCFHK